MRPSRSTPWLLGFGLPIVLGVGLLWNQAHSVPFQIQSRDQALALLPRHPGVLINLRSHLFPATWDLTLLGQRSTQALNQGLLQNTDSYVRWKCAQILTQLRDASARPILHQALGDWSDVVRGQVIQALALVGDQSSVPFLLKRLEDTNETPNNRRLTLHALGKIGDARSETAIAAEYTKAKTDVSLRRAAISALWELRQVVPAARLKPFLRQALLDSDPYVARRAAIASGVLQDKDALPALQTLLFGQNPMLRNVSAYVLGQIGDKKAISTLVQALPTVRSGRLLNNITFALQRLDDPQILERLKGFLNHKQAFIRLNAAFTVGDMKVKAARLELEKALHDPNLLVRNQAILALGKLDDPASIPALLQAIQTNAWEQRWYAMLAVLFLSKGKQHRDVFYQALLGTQDPALRARSAAVLASFKDQRVAPYYFHLLNRNYGAAEWKAAKDLQNPLLQTLMKHRLHKAIQAASWFQIEKLLDFSGKTAAQEFKDQLLSTLIEHIYQPDSVIAPRQPSWRLNRRSQRFRPQIQQQAQAPNPRSDADLFPRRGLWGQAYILPGILRVIRSLGQSGDPALIPWLRPFLSHQAYEARMSTHLALALLGETSSLQYLYKAFLKASEHHRPSLSLLLADLPTSTLQTLLAPHILASADPYLRLASGATLLASGDQKARSVFLEILRSSQGAWRDRARFYLLRSMTPTLRDLLAKDHAAETNPTAKEILGEILEASRERLPSFAIADNPSFTLFRVQNIQMK